MNPKQDGIAGTTRAFAVLVFTGAGSQLLAARGIIPIESETSVSTGGSLNVCCLRWPLYGPRDPIQVMG